MRQLRPTKDQVLVEPIWPPTKVGSLHIPDTAREQWPDEAVVVATGPRAPEELATGVRVIVNRFNGTLVQLNGKVHRLLVAADVLAMVEQPGLE